MIIWQEKKNKFFLYYLKFENQKSSKKKQEKQLSVNKKDIYKIFSYFFLVHLNFSVNIGTKSVNTLDTCKIKNIFLLNSRNKCLKCIFIWVLMNNLI